MENSGYVTLSRQSGLMREMQIVAHNIANSATAGFRQEGLVFSEFVRQAGEDASISMAAADTRATSMLQGALTQTNGEFDLAIEGSGFFLIDTARGERMTRAGSFSPNAEGDLVTPDGHRVLDIGGAPIFVPPDVSGLSVAADGTVSAGDRLIGQIGIVRSVDPLDMSREGGVLFRTDGGVEPDPGGRVLQGYIESSNVDPIGQVARMIEVQRAYELGQSFLQAEDERIRSAVKTLVR